MSHQNSHPWVVAGGAPGELAYCEHCGAGLTAALPIDVTNLVKITKTFDNQHANCKERTYFPKTPTTPDEWAAGRDTGTSSLAIYSVLCGRPSPHGRYSPPQDGADFGRCYRFLLLFPEFRPRLDEVARKLPDWAAMISAWNELEYIYAKSLQNRSFEALNLRIRALLSPA